MIIGFTNKELPEDDNGTSEMGSVEIEKNIKCGDVVYMSQEGIRYVTEYLEKKFPIQTFSENDQLEVVRVNVSEGGETTYSIRIPKANDAILDLSRNELQL